MKFLRFIKNNLKTPYNLVFLNRKNLIEEYILPLRLWIFFLIFFMVLLLFGALGYFSNRVLYKGPEIAKDEIDQETVIQLQERIEELQAQQLDNEEYVADVQKILKGEIPTQSVAFPTDTLEDFQETDTLHETRDSMEGNSTVTKPIKKEKEVLRNNEYQIDNANQFYFTPLIGTITNPYDLSKNHAAVDIQGKQGEPIKSIADGVVLFADWTAATGYVVMIQHPNNVISVYKHNSQVYKKMGDKVKTGEVIAAVGNTGELTTGPHLHFEIWVNGNAENPTKYISF